MHRPEEALPLAVHHGLTEVLVVARSEGPILVTRLTLVPDWDGLAPEVLHAALRDGVAAETRALGFGQVSVAADTVPAATAPSP